MSRRGTAYVYFVLFWSLLVAGETLGQSGSRAPDSLKTYRLSEIVVGGDTERALSMETVRRIPIAAIAREDASAASSLVRLIPSAFLQTNSRGETLIYLRSAGERQVAVFFDGALLNIPWDNRVDVSLIPAGILGGMEVSRGVPSVVYGTNVIGGAVNLQSRSLDGPGSHVDVGLQLGSNAARMIQGTYLLKSSAWSAVASGSMYATDGQSVPSGARLEFSQSGSSLRSNTDRKIGNVFLRVGHHLSDRTEIGLSLLHIDSEKGIAPEGHIDPSQDAVRFWRYPLWRNTMAIFNAISTSGAEDYLHATLWAGRFDQHIAQYESSHYDLQTDLQKDLDGTVGLRLTGSRSIGHGTLRGAINGLYSRHEQTDVGYTLDGSIGVKTNRIFAQTLFSTGIEYELRLSSRSAFQIGASVDGSASPETGDKPTRDPELAVGLTAGIRLDLDVDTWLRWSVGRKVRFPTMRELFGEALRRFVLNPDLTPETSLQSELAFERAGERVSGEVIVFYRRTFDTIDQEIVEVDGEWRRKRVNLEGSSVWGLEVSGVARLLDPLSTEGHVSWMDPKGFENGKEIRLNEKPGLLARLSMLWSSRWGGSIQATWVGTGSAWALAVDGKQARLPSSSSVNLRAAYSKYFKSVGLFSELYAGVSNVGNDASFSQLGLPDPGREYRVGVSMSF